MRPENTNSFHFWKTGYNPLVQNIQLSTRVDLFSKHGEGCCQEKERKRHLFRSCVNCSCNACVLDCEVKQIGLVEFVPSSTEPAKPHKQHHRHFTDCRMNCSCRACVLDCEVKQICLVEFVPRSTEPAIPVNQVHWHSTIKVSLFRIDRISDGLNGRWTDVRLTDAQSCTRSMC